MSHSTYIPGLGYDSEDPAQFTTCVDCGALMQRSVSSKCPPCMAEYQRKRYHRAKAYSDEDYLDRLNRSAPQMSGTCMSCGDNIRGNQSIPLRIPSAGGKPEQELHVCRPCDAHIRRLSMLDKESYELVIGLVNQSRLEKHHEAWQLKPADQEFGYVNPRTIAHSYDPITYLAPDRETADEMYYQDFPEERPEPKTPQEPQAA